MLSRTARPQKLSEVAGQPLVKKVLKAIIDNPEKAPRAIILGGSFGSGKCVLGSTRVATSRGYLPIASLMKVSLGDSDDKFTPYETDVDAIEGAAKSSHFYKHKRTVVGQLELETGFCVNGTPEHKILMFNGDKEGLLPIGKARRGDLVYQAAFPIGEDWPESIDEEFYNLSTNEMIDKAFRMNLKDRIKFIRQVIEEDAFKYTASELSLNCENDYNVNRFTELLTTLGFRVWLGASNIIMFRIPKCLEEEFGDEYKSYIDDTYLLEYGGKKFYGLAITDLGKTEDVVYDLSVPEVHNFYAQGTYNHNTTCARILARALNCTGKGEKPCGKCPNCQQDLDSSPFYTELDASVVGNVEKLRELKETFYSTLKNGMRVVVFDECLSYSNALYCLQDGVPISLPIGEIVEKKLPVEVYSLNVDTGEFSFKSISHYFANGVKVVKDYAFEAEGRTFIVTCTENHLFRTVDGEWVKAKDIEYGREMFYFSLNGYTGVAKLSYTSEEREESTYDLEIDENHTYVANGLVCHNCHLLSRVAMGSLLKVLEDTPEGIMFILATTDTDKLLPTVRSRALELKFDTVPESDAIENIKHVAEINNIEVDDEVLRLIYRASNGHMRSAHQLLDFYSLTGKEGFMEATRDSKQAWLAYLEAVAKGDKEAVLKAVDNLQYFPLSSLKRDYEEIMARLARAIVEENELTPIFKAFGNNVLKFIKVAISPFVLESFSADQLLSAALLCVFQMTSGGQQSQPTVSRQVSRNARR